MATKSKKTKLTPEQENAIIQTAQNFANQFMSFKKQSAEGLLQMSKAVSDVKSKHKDALKKFCILTELDPSSSTFRKYNAIGQNFDRLMEYVEKLPNNWTTLYKVASLSPTEFQKLVDSNMLNPGIKAATIREVLGNASIKNSSVKNTSGTITLSVVISRSLNKGALESVRQSLDVLQSKHLIKVNLESIQSEIESPTPMDSSLEKLAA